jgi:hypothetical protein
MSKKLLQNEWVTGRVGSRGAAFDFCTGGSRFESRLEHCMSSLRFSVILPTPSKAIPGLATTGSCYIPSLSFVNRPTIDAM